MLKNIIVLSDGTEISSGTGAENAIKSCTITECVNDGEELSMGSACSSCVELTIIAPNGWLSVPDSFTLYKENDAGIRTKVGIFHPEKPVKSSANTYKITAFDNVSKLDKDLSAWLKGLTGWPYTLTTFAGMVCEACGFTLSTKTIPNGDFPVQQFYKADVTGRQIMKWIGEVCCRFCRANAEGNIELAWYKPSKVTITPAGERYYFAKSLSYEDYEVAPIDAVKLRLADSDSGALWPSGNAGNPYIIAGNPILLAKVTEGLTAYLEVIHEELATLPSYRPCKVSIPACLDVHAGDVVEIIDKNGKAVTTCVMTKTQKGQRDTLECTGSARRDSPTAINNQSMGVTAAAAAQNALNGMTQEQVFNKLTDNGKIQGIYAQDGKWYINAELAVIQNLKVNAADITGVITVKGSSGDTLFSAGDNAVSIAGWKADNNSIRYGDLGAPGSMWLCRTGTNKAPNDYGQTGFAGSDATKNGWCIAVGNNFGVDKAGALFASGATISGTINAANGAIGDWNIGTKTIKSGGTELYTGSALYSDRFYEDGIETQVVLTPTTVFVDRRTQEGQDLSYATWKQIITAVHNSMS